MEIYITLRERKNSYVIVNMINYGDLRFNFIFILKKNKLV